MTALYIRTWVTKLITEKVKLRSNTDVFCVPLQILRRGVRKKKILNVLVRDCMFYFRNSNM